MVDHHPPRHPQRKRPLDDQLHREPAHLAGLVQMDIHPHPMLLRQREHRIQMPLRIAVDRARVQPPYRFAPHGKRLVHQLHRPRPHQHSALRKRNQVDPHHIQKLRPRLHDPLDARQPAIRVDIDMRPDMGRPKPHRLQRLPPRLPRRRDRQGPPGHPLVVDLVDQPWSPLVAVPRHPQHRLVEMRMRLDQTRQRNPPRPLQHRDRRPRRIGREPPRPDQEVGGSPTHRPDIANKQIIHSPTLAAPRCSSKP